jgi:prefoldin subunit 5
LNSFWSGVFTDFLPLFLATIGAAALLGLLKEVRSVSRDVKNLKKIEDGMKTLFSINSKQNQVQAKMLENTSAVLVAIKTGVANGNISSAEARNAEAKSINDKATEEAQDFLLKQYV